MSGLPDLCSELIVAGIPVSSLLSYCGLWISGLPDDMSVLSDEMDVAGVPVSILMSYYVIISGIKGSWLLLLDSLLFIGCLLVLSQCVREYLVVGRIRLLSFQGWL